MGKQARKIENEILANLPPNKRLFKINAGMGWVGKIVKHTGDTIILKNPRPLHAAPTGWFDLSGWRSIEITPDMVGKKIAVFCGVEVKAGSDRLSKAQKSLGRILEKMGGEYEIVKD